MTSNITTRQFSLSKQKAKAVAIVRFSDTPQARMYLILAIVLLGVSYIWIVNSATAAQFQLTDLRKQSVVLEDAYQKAQLEQTALRSLERTQQATAELRLVSVENIEYANADPAVALAGR